jgi:hypothetical protein
MSKTMRVLLVLAFISLIIIGIKTLQNFSLSPEPSSKPSVVSYTWTKSGIVTVTVRNDGGDGLCTVDVKVLILVGVWGNSTWPFSEVDKTMQTYLRKGESTTLQFVFGTSIEGVSSVTASGV